MGLSSTKIATALKSKPAKLHDGDGLYLDIRSATSASWLFKFTQGGKTEEVGLGSLWKMSGDTFDLTIIREVRRRCIVMLAEGKNPKDELRREKHERIRAANAPRPQCIGELVRDNIHLIAKQAKSKKQQQAWIDSLQEARIGRIAKLLPQEVTDADAITLMKAYYAKAPVMADDVRQRLFRVLAWAVKTPGHQNPFRWVGHLEDEVVRQSADEEEGHAALDHPRIGEFVNRLRGENERQMMALALEWLILSGSRAKEACAADWSEIEWGPECWVIPASRMKMRREHAVPLTERHFAILANLKPMGLEQYPASGPIFQMPGGDAVSVTGVRKFLNSRRDPEGKPYMDPVQNAPITLHGFRTTFRSWGEEQLTSDKSDHLYSEKLLETCLAHAIGSKTRRAYVRSAQVEVRRNIMGTWAAYCAVVQAEKVVPLRQRRAA